MKPCGGRRISRILEADCALCRIPIYSISAPGLGTDMVLSLSRSLVISAVARKVLHMMMSCLPMSLLHLSQHWASI